MSDVTFRRPEDRAWDSRMRRPLMITGSNLAEHGKPILRPDA